MLTRWTGLAAAALLAALAVLAEGYVLALLLHAVKGYPLFEARVALNSVAGMAILAGLGGLVPFLVFAGLRFRLKRAAVPLMLWAILTGLAGFLTIAAAPGPG